jgi:hypothetical protein
MQKLKLEMREVVNIINGISMVENLDILDSKTTFWLSRTKEKLLPVDKPYEKTREKLQKEAITQSKGKSAEEVETIDETLRTQIEGLLGESIEEMEFYEFKREMFEAKEDLQIPVKAVSDKGEALSHKTIKKGQSLVPVKFFSLMGRLIQE